jgi:DNA-binding response OmpR family regulator
MHEITNPPLQQRPTIFVVEEDNNARHALTKNLRQFGYRLLVAAHVEDALEWVSASAYIHADLLLVDLVGKSPEEALRVGQRLRLRARYHEQTPLIVMPERVAKDLEGTDKNVSANDWICYYQDADQVQRLLVRLLSAPPN